MADEFLHLLLAQCRLNLIEFLAFGGGGALGQRWICAQQHRRAVRVVEQEAANQFTEIAGCIGLQPLLECGQWSLEGNAVNRVVAVQPTAKRTQHQRDAAWERASVIFAQRKLDRVHRRIDSVLLDCAIGQRAQGVEYQCFDLIGVLRVDVLQARRKC